MSLGRATRAACAVAMLAVVWPSNLDAQNRSTPGASAAGMPTECTGTCVAIRSTGGFLGYLDGFPEYPGWPGDSFAGNPDLIPNPTPPPDPARPVPYGGLLGVATYLKSHGISSGTDGKTDATVLLISGNNHPQQVAAQRDPARTSDERAIPAASHWFWKLMIETKPQAVGVGTEDIHRWLAQMRPEHLMTWIRDGIAAGLPLVASNVIVRLSEAGLNVVRNDDHDITIEVAEGESLGMLDAVTLRHPCTVGASLRSASFTFDQRRPFVRVRELTAAEERAESDSSSSRARRAVLGQVCRTTIEFDERLRPGKSYLLQSSLTGPGFRFRLTTHDVLTPHTAWDGLPVVGVTRAGVPMAVMSFLSPSTANGLPPEYFKWEKDQGCRAAECRIEFVAAEEAARSLLDGMTQRAGPPPVLLTISDLEEAETTALLDVAHEIRFLAMHPDAGRLGRAAPEVEPLGAEERRYSGDQSFGAVVDALHPDLTRFMVRPTWLGEIVHTAFADFAPPVPGRGWRVTDASLWVQPVPGASLGAVPDGTGVRYTAFLDPARFRNSPGPLPAEPTLFLPYCPIDPNGPFDATSGERQGDLWTNPASFAGLVLDDMRRSMRADIAIVPESWIDPDVIAAIAHPPATGVPPLSGFMLQRVLYRSKRVVRVAVEGSQLGDVLERIVAAGTATDDHVCLSGVGLANSCPLETIAVDDLLVNVRKPEEGNYYRLVMPASLARAEHFTFNESTTRDLLVDLDARLAACQPASKQTLRPGTDPVAERLENRLAARPQHYVKLDPLTFEYASTGVTEPDGGSGIFSRLPVDSSGERPSRRIAFAGDVNAVLWDTRNFAFRVPGQLRYGQTTVDEETSYDEDEFSVGLRIDRKRFPARWSRMFAGVFMDGRLFDRVDPVGSVRELGSIADPRFPGVTLNNVTTSGPTVEFTTAPQRNLAGALGLEVPEQTFGPMTLTGLQFSLYHGRVYNVPVAVQLGDQTIDLVEFLKGSASDTLNAHYQQNLTGITGETPFGYVTATRGQSRLQIDLTTTTKLPFAIPKEMTLSTEHRYRWYRHDEEDLGLFTERSGNTKVSIDIGIGKRWSIGPYVERTDVVVGIRGEDHLHFSVVRWGGQVRVPLFWNGKSIE